MMIRKFLNIAMAFLINGLCLSDFAIGQSLSAVNTGIPNVEMKKNITDDEQVLVRKCDDFSPTGNGEDSQWEKSEWYDLTKLDPGGQNYTSKFKILYSGTGIYLLFSGQDDKISTKFDKDFDKLWNGDVYEVFFHPDPAVPVYLEYEINALNKEILLMLSRYNGKSLSWIPRNYENGKRTTKMVSVTGGKMEMNGLIKSWTAELFFPYELLGLLPRVPPKSGTIWNANFCRLDYDSGSMVKWSWSPAIKTSFHELEQFRSIKFE